MQKEKNSQRNSSIELLRILAAVSVVLQHNIDFVSHPVFSMDYFFINSFESVLKCAVDLFVIISAYFLSGTGKRKLYKVFELLFQVTLIKLTMSYVVGFIQNGMINFSIKGFILKFLPINYFVILYVVLYLISPYINLMLKNLSQKKFKRLLVTSTSIFLFFTIACDALSNFMFYNSELNDFSPVGRTGNVDGYSIVNFVIIYLIGAYIRRFGISISFKKNIVLIIITFFLIYAWSLIELKMGVYHFVSWNYNNPLLVMLAALILMLFLQIEIHSKIINNLAESAFMCYIFGLFFIGYVDLTRLQNSNIFAFLLCEVGVAFLTYLASYPVYKVYTICTAPLFKKLRPILDRVNISVE